MAIALTTGPWVSLSSRPERMRPRRTPIEQPLPSVNIKRQRGLRSTISERKALGAGTCHFEVLSQIQGNAIILPTYAASAFLGFGTPWNSKGR